MALNAEEQQAIVSVIKRNEQLEMAERQRVGKLVERVERIKQRASYYGPKNCRYVMSHVARVDLRNFCFFPPPRGLQLVRPILRIWDSAEHDTQADMS